MTPRIGPLLGCLVLAAVTACSSGSSNSPSASDTATVASTAAAAGPNIAIANFEFASPPSVRPGATVTVVNSDHAEHSVTADEGKAFDVDVDGNGKATFTAPAQPGTYAYHCSYHSMMHGQLIVQ